MREGQDWEKNSGGGGVERGHGRLVKGHQNPINKKNASALETSHLEDKTMSAFEAHEHHDELPSEADEEVEQAFATYLQAIAALRMAVGRRDARYQVIGDVERKRVRRQACTHATWCREKVVAAREEQTVVGSSW